MDDLVHRRHSYPRIETPLSFRVNDPSAIELPQITRTSSDRLVSGVSFYQVTGGIDSENHEPPRYSTSDFNKDVDDIQSNTTITSEFCYSHNL